MKYGLTRRELEVTDRDKILEILDKCKIVHIAMVDDGEPYVVPLNYGYILEAAAEEGESDQLTLYLHGALKGRKIDVMRKNPKVFFEMNCDVVPFDGKIACQFGTSYSSIMGRGEAEILEDVEEKKVGLSLFMKSQTGMDFEFTDKMVSAVSVIRIKVKDYTAKKRPHPLERVAE